MLPHEKDFCTSKHSRHCHDRPSRPTPLPGKEKSERDILYPEQRIFKKGTVTSLGSQMPYKTPAPHATHGQDSAAARDPRQGQELSERRAAAVAPSRRPHRRAPRCPHAVPAAGARGSPAPPLHSRRGRPSSERRANGAARPRPTPRPHSPARHRGPPPRNSERGGTARSPNLGAGGFQGLPGYTGGAAERNGSE